MSNPYAAQQKAALQSAPAQNSEGWALIEMARRLDASVQVWEQDPGDLLNAVRLNWRLWTIFQAELLEPECPVPAEIRQNLLNLSNFIDKRSVDIIAKPAPEKITVLININRQIGAGLLGNPSEETLAAENQPAQASQALETVLAAQGDQV